MSWFRKLLPPKIKRDVSQQKKAVPEGLWSKCPSCEAVLYFTDLENNLHVCPKCGFHNRLSARQRLDLDLAVAELTVATRLLLVTAVRLGRHRDGLAVRNPWRFQVDLDAEASLQLGDRHLDVQLSLAREQEFVGLRVTCVAD